MNFTKSDYQKQTIHFFGEQFGKLPSLSASAQHTLASLTPWLALIFGVMGVFASLAAVGIVGAFSPFLVLGGGIGVATGSIVSAVLALVASGLMLASVPHLFAHKYQGWKLLFWSEMASLLSAVLSFSLGGVVIVAISLYLLFQIMSHFKK